MPVLLGLEVAALSAVAYKLPAVRATARESASYLYETLVGSEPAVSPVEADDRQPASSSPSSPPRKKQPPPPAATVMLPTLYANPEAALSSPLRLKGVLTQIANAVPRRFGGDVGGQWHLLFSTATDGTSLAHMIRTCAGDAALLLVVRDPSGRVYGAFCPVLREPSTGGGGGLGIAAAVESGGEILGTNAAAVGGNTDSSSGSSTSSPNSTALERPFCLHWPTSPYPRLLSTRYRHRHRAPHAVASAGPSRIPSAGRVAMSRMRFARSDSNPALIPLPACR